ncbi:MAG: hypothetical protein ACAH59_01330 [Pseudobdellovibrionaceae bacterium]
MKKHLLILLILSSSLSSCKRVSEEDQNLQLSVSPTAPYVLPVAMKTCKEQTEHADSSGVSANAFEYNRFTFQWTGSNSFELVFLQLVYDSQDLATTPYSCVISDDNLDETLFPEDRFVAAASADSPTTVTAGCAIRCGSMKFKDDVKYSYVVGKITAFGVQIDEDGEVLPVEATGDAAIQYKKVGY